MPKKLKLTKKDSSILVLGVLLGFLIQIAYDLAHEFAFFGAGSINWYWIFLQICFLGIVGIFARAILGQIEQE